MNSFVVVLKKYYCVRIDNSFNQTTFTHKFKALKNALLLYALNAYNFRRIYSITSLSNIVMNIDKDYFYNKSRL